MGTVSKLAEPQAESSGVVRLAQKFSLTACTIKDIDECTTMGRAMHEESAYANIPFSDLVVHEMIGHAINDDAFKSIVARDMDGQLIGMSLVYRSKYYFAAHEFAVYDRCIYVAPAWRGSSLFMRMLALLVEWSKSIGASELVLGTTTKVNTEQYEDALVRLGLERVGGVYKMNLR